MVDLFAGPGGWDVAARQLGLRPVGIEHDRSACLTRAAAGHLTIRADVAEYPTRHLAGKVEGLIASPPCPTFSAAGDGSGRDDMPHLLAAAARIGRDGWCDLYQLHDWADPRTPLVLQPLRWVADLQPDWIALEQVPQVIDLWACYARIWRHMGYTVWAAVLNAADFGVPQTRKRAILGASRTRQVTAPSPTHCKYGSMSLFGHLAPWVSMADSLGLGCHRQTGSRRERERERERVGYRRVRGDGMTERHGDRSDRPVTEPAPTITGKARSDMWVVDRRTNSKAAGGRMEPTPLVPMDSPAPTLISKAGQWVFYSSTQANATMRTLDQPAPTILASADNGDSRWIYERPATTVCADPRLAPPGYRTGTQRSLTPCVPSEQVQTGDHNGEAIKLTVAEALILQSFPPDYPVQGSRSAKFTQVGNAIPPVLAWHILRTVIRPGGDNR